MQLKDLLIVFVIISLSIFLYYIPMSLESIYNNFKYGFSFRTPFFEIFSAMNQIFNLIFGFIGIIGVVLFFVQQNNIYNAFLKIYLIDFAISTITFLPIRILWLLNIPGQSVTTEWYHHAIFLCSIVTIILSFIVYSNQKIRTLPAPVSSKSVRFLHLFIDNLFLNIAVLGNLSFVLFRNSYGDGDIFLIVGMTIVFLTPFIYYTLCEAAFKQTIGKVVTGSYVRSKNGTPPSLGNIMIRSLCRYIPFEPFSFLDDNGKWHDRFSDTDVFYKSNIVFEEENSIIDAPFSEDLV